MPDLVASATAVAFTVIVAGLGTDVGAMYTPALSMNPCAESPVGEPAPTMDQNTL